MAHYPIGTLSYWHIDTLVIDTLAYWHIGILAHWHIIPLAHYIYEREKLTVYPFRFIDPCLL
ncbi:polyprotein [Bacteroides sp. 519]|nr:polyprotein [Bacteroides sp. 519]